ncbi:MAG: BatA domain-containing protein [Salinigranum sp.]
MALLDGFLAPLGLLALLAALPIVVLYLVRPTPERRVLPTLRFLTEERSRRTANPVFERLRRSLLLLLQVLAVALLALALAAPYTTVAESSTVNETVLVVDTSASMATVAGGATRFERATAAAKDAATGTTSVVTTDAGGHVRLRRGGPREAADAVDALRVTDAPGDLRAAVAAAASIAGESARIIVCSDFADGSDWSEAVRTARERGLRVDLRQFSGGGADNVGIVDLSFSGTRVTATVKNFGDAPATRRLSLGGRRATLSLAPGDVKTAEFPVPAGGGELRLTPGDSFPTDDVAYVAAPTDATVDVLVLTNDPNTYLLAALSVLDSVDVTVKSPPTTVTAADYDVVIYSNVRGDRLLRGNVEAGREVLDSGGGVAIQAQEDLPKKYGDLLLVDPAGNGTNPTVGSTADDPLTDGLSFPPPERYVRGSLRDGRTLVATSDGTPLLAVAERSGGRVLYDGFSEDGSSFKFDYRYPVFWKRAVYYLAGRESLRTLNRHTGGELRFDGGTRVRTPRGEASAARVPLADAGFYVAGDRRYGASLLSEPESSVRAPNLTAGEGPVGVRGREERTRVPKPLTPWIALAALAVGLVELGYLRRRGDL